MLQFAFKDGAVVISTTLSEVGLFVAAIGEAIEASHGLDREFRARIGEPLDRAYDLLGRLNEVWRRGELGPEVVREFEKLSYTLAVDEVKLIHTALIETLRVVEEWEFHTRTGHTPDEARKVAVSLTRILERARS